MFRKSGPLVAFAALGLAAGAWAEDAIPSLPLKDNSVVAAPLKVAETPDQSVYALPQPQTEDQGINLGGVNLDMKATYFTDYVYRGVDRAEQLNPTRPPGSSANFQLDAMATWDLGKLPHPFVGVFMNVLESDPISNFQEVRPYFGFEWKIRPLVVAAGNNIYTYPSRTEFETSEAWVKVTLDDAALLRLDEPLLSPYVYAAYDYDRYDGLYVELGVRHDFVIRKTGLTLTPVANVAYVSNHEFFARTPNGPSTGFQHWEVGLIAKYSLNVLLNIPQRFGEYALTGYLFYTHDIDKKLLADDLLYGGAGIEFSY